MLEQMLIIFRRPNSRFPPGIFCVVCAAVETGKGVCVRERAQ